MAKTAKRLLIVALTVLLVVAFGVAGIAMAAEAADEPVCYLQGDVSPDGSITKNDAIYLLYASIPMFAEDYPLNQDGDFQKDGVLNKDDAIYLLYASIPMFAEDYPLAGTIHTYHSPVWSWDEENETASVTFKCGCGQEHVQQAAVNVEVQSGATCTAAGSIQLTASLTFDGEEYTATKTLTIPASGQHRLVGTQDCENGVSCQLCDYELPALGHNWAKVGGTPATCTSHAVETYHCTTCYATKDVELEGVMDHTYVQLAEDAQLSSCQFAKQFACKDCGAKKPVAEEDKYYSHNYTAQLTKEVTCIENGVKTYTCTCGASYTEGIAADGVSHVWDVSSEDAGKIVYACQCGQTKLDSIVAPINPDNHKTTEIRGAAAANCYKPGYTGDTYCTDCGNLLKPGEEIPATQRHVAGSAWITDGEDHWHICTTEGCGTIVDKAAHSYSWVVDDPATEDKTGLKHEQCICGLKRNEGTVIDKLDHVHIGIKHFEAVKATCVKEGTLEYWTCASHKCTGKYFADAKCQLELETIVEAINPANHTGKTELKDNAFATCSKAGYSGDTYCTDCGEMVKKGAVIPATGLHTAKDGYLTDGNQHWQVCVRCEAIIGNAKENHTYTWVVDQYPTEEAEGVKHQKCTVCSHEAAKDTVIEKLEHKPVLVPGTDATCTEVGVTEHYLCGNCGRYYASVDGKLGEQIEKSATVIEAAGHTYSTEWSSNETDHWHDCSCGETADKQAHTTEIVGAKEVTETEAGYTGDKVCSVCGYVVSKGEEIPALPPVTEPAATEPADTDSGKSDSPVVIILIVVAAVAVCVAVAVILIKKRKIKA